MKLTIDYIIYLILPLSMSLWTSCAEDKGNYTYKDINEVSVTGLEEGKKYTKVAYADSLQFDPQIVSTMNITDEDKYEYEWKLIPQGTDFDDIEDVEGMTISRERKLNVQVTQSPGDYSGFFIVKDKETGVSWITGFGLLVRSMTSEGWLVLCEQNGKSRLDVIFNETADKDIEARDIWDEEEFNPGKPVRLLYTYTNYQDIFTLLVTDRSTYNLDKKDLHVGEDNDLKWRFGIVPDAVKVTASASSLYSINKYWYIVDDKQELYSQQVDISGSVLEFPINYLNGKEKFTPAPFIGVNINNQSFQDGQYGCAPAVLYDATHQQFVVMRNNAVYPSVLEFSSISKFDPKETVGRDMLYMESTRHGLIYALLKDAATGKVFFYGMKLRANTEPAENWWEEPTYEEYNEQQYYGEVSGEGIDNAH